MPSERSLASAVLVQGVHGGHRKGFPEFVPPAFVNSQTARVNRPEVLERMVFGSAAESLRVKLLRFFLFF